MNKAVVFLLFVAAASAAYSQTAPQSQTQPQSTAPASSQSKNAVTGFGGASWGQPISEVRKIVKGKIFFDDEKKLILSRDGEITYRYGFFAKMDADKAPQTASAEQPAAASGEESKFFYAISEFPYIALDRIREKLAAQYGEPTGDTVKKSQGAIVWDSGSGAVIAWVDAYEKKPYCRKISYISKEIAKELNKYQSDVFSKKERDVIKNLIP
jgi:hypothetical protein